MPAGVRCIYCNGTTSGVRKGEHVVPGALGGELTLRCVCSKCNTEFSKLDKEICSRSPLSLVVQQQLGTESTTTWDYNADLDVALETRIPHGFSFPVLWPQLLFLDDKTYFQCDQDEAESIGFEDYTKGFYNLIQHATEVWLAKEKGIIWERIRRHPDRGRFPPRLFTRHTYAEWKRGMTFICRYYDPIKRGQIVRKARAWKPVITRATTGTSVGVADPEALSTYQPDLVVRALVKIGLNLLTHVLGAQTVNSVKFPLATEFVLRGTGFGIDFVQNGFVTQSTLTAANCPAESHKFELLYVGRAWRLVAVFFGGIIGACVHFPGPQSAEYIRYEIVAPVRRREWEITKSRVHLPSRQIETLWDDASKIIPSMPIRHRGSRTRIESRNRPV